MTYTEFAQELRRIAGLLEKHGSHLEGTALAAKTATYQKQSLAYKKILEDVSGGFAPGIRELEKLLTSPDKKFFTAAALQLLLKDTTGIGNPSKKTPAALKKIWLDALKEQGNGEKALSAAQAHLAKLKTPKAPVPKDQDALRLEFNRLGGLTDGELAIELDTRYKKITDLRKLAEANGIPSKGQARDALIPLIAERARRVNAHIL